MKKIASFALSLLLMALLAACGGASKTATPSASGTPAPSAAPASDTAVSSPSEASGSTENVESAAPSEQAEDIASGELGDYAVSIVSCEQTEDIDGNPAIIVTYEWTNNSDEATSFLLSLSSQALQNDVECEPASVDDEDFDAESLMANIEPGETATVQEAYLLQDTKSDIVIDVVELFTLESNPPAVSETFTFDS